VVSNLHEMNKYWITAIFLLINHRTSVAQNLVVNPSFEDTLQCPYFVSQIDFATNWHTSVNTPDYYHACNNNGPINPGMVGVPYSARGYQPARTGNAFAGEVNYWTAQTDYRETFFAQLLTPLTAGVLYNVGMYVIMNEDNAMWAVDGRLGIYFSVNPINPLTPFIYTPQISNPPGNVLNDTLNWTEISGTFAATGGEQYITIGSFIHDSQLTIINRGGTYPFTSYAIDDVWLIPDSLVGISEDLPSLEGDGIVLSPNPANDFVKISFKKNPADGIITIFDLTGREIKKINPGKKKSVTVSTNNFSPGVYFLKVGDIVMKLVIEN